MYNYLSTRGLLWATLVGTIILIIVFNKGQKEQQKLYLEQAGINIRTNFSSPESSPLIREMYNALDSIKHIKDTVRLQELAEIFGVGYDYNFFVDGHDETIIAHRNPGYVGNTIDSIGGPLWKAIFYDLLLRLPPNKVSALHYPGLPKTDRRGERYGVFYNDTSRGLLFGMVVTEEYLNWKQKQDLTKANELGNLLIGLLGVIVIGLVCSLWIILGLAEKRKKEAETNKALLLKEAEYVQIIDSSNSAIAVMDNKSRVIRVNDTFNDWYGAGFLNRLMNRESSYSGFKQAFEDCLEKGRTTYYNSGNRTGRLRASLITLSKIDLKNDSRVVFIASDVTEQTLLRRAIGHELKTPISILIGSLAPLRKEIKNSKTLDRIYGITQQLNTHAESLEQWAGLHYNQISALLQTVNIGEVLKEILNERYFALFRASNIEVQHFIEFNLIAELTPGHLDLIVLNILSNAVKALSRTESNEKKIKVIARKEGRFISIFIEDSGPGMGLEVQRRIYRPNSGYNSLGSDLVAHLVLLNKGHVSVDSNGEENTMVTLKFVSYDL